MKNECLRLIGNDNPCKSLYESQEMYIVSEIVDGRRVETRLPKEKAQTLFRKIGTVNDTAWIRKEVLEQTEEPYISAFEIEL